MPLRKKVSKKPTTPCPDPELYILVRTKHGAFWRRKRGTIKPIRLNDNFKRNVEATFITSPAARRIMDALEPFTRRLQKGYLLAHISGRLKKALNEKGHIDFTYFEDFDFQPEWPLKRRLLHKYTLKLDGRLLEIRLDIDEFLLKQGHQHLTDYYFEAICVYGDATRDRALQVDSVSSPLYSFESRLKQTCVLTVSPPRTGDPWMVILKLNCLMGNSLDAHPKYNAMAVVMVG
jgi:hypothetical protein